MRCALALTTLLLIACDPTSDPKIACDRTRTSALEACATERVTVVRALCAQHAQEAYGACLEDAGEVERGRVEGCFGACDFERVQCQEAVEVRGLEIDCDAEEMACEDACRAQ